METKLNTVETTGKTVEEAILMAVAQLGTRREKLDIEVLSEPETALLELSRKKKQKFALLANWMQQSLPKSIWIHCLKKWALMFRLQLLSRRKCCRQN